MIRTHWKVKIANVKTDRAAVMSVYAWARVCVCWNLQVCVRQRPTTKKADINCGRVKTENVAPIFCCWFIKYTAHIHSTNTYTYTYYIPRRRDEHKQRVCFFLLVCVRWFVHVCACTYDECQCICELWSSQSSKLPISSSLSHQHIYKWSSSATAAEAAAQQRNSYRTKERPQSQPERHRQRHKFVIAFGYFRKYILNQLKSSHNNISRWYCWKSIIALLRKHYWSNTAMLRQGKCSSSSMFHPHSLFL